MSIYSDKLAHVQVIINCQYSVAQMITSEDVLAYILGMPSIDNAMSYNLLTLFVHFGINLEQSPIRPLVFNIQISSWSE